MKVFFQTFAAFIIFSGSTGCDEAKNPVHLRESSSHAAQPDGNAAQSEETQSANPSKESSEQPQNQVVDKCLEAGTSRFTSAQSDVCGGIWNVYASFKGGWTWWSDKNGEDSAAQTIDAQAVEVQKKLERCGIITHVSLSDWFDDFTPDLVVVHSNPHYDSNQSAAELETAKACNLDGYSKASSFMFVGRDQTECFLKPVQYPYKPSECSLPLSL